MFAGQWLIFCHNPSEPPPPARNWYDDTLRRPKGTKRANFMAKKSKTERAKEKVAGAAKIGVDTVRDIAGQAIRAAAVAAAGVALHRTAQALRGGASTAEAAAPRPALPARPSARRAPRARAKKAAAGPAKKKASRRRSAR
jgi:hypothetical protein